MRLFLTLCSMAVLAYGKPQGYNYGSGVSGTFNGFNGGLSGGQSSFITAPGTQQFSAGISGHSGHNGAGFGTISTLSGSSNSQGFNTIGAPTTNFGFQSVATNTNTNYQQQQQQTAKFEAPIVHKQFFTIAAQEDAESLERSKHLVIGRPQKNYRVVFIKAPSSNSANVKLSAEYAPQEEKTVIYVLTKKDSSLEVNDIATPAPVQPSKPEVFFIKYKTEQEAQHAQRQIQAEYDKIEGTSEHTDGGIAQQQSVIGILDGNTGNSGSSTIAHSNDNGGFVNTNIVQTTTNTASSTNFASLNPKAPTYLPPSTSV